MADIRDMTSEQLQAAMAAAEQRYHAANRKARTIRETIEADPRVEEVSDERDGDDGIWVYLRPGWRSAIECHFVHEWNWTDCRDELRTIEPCDCSRCTELAAKA